MSQAVRLTRLAHGGGCGCKLAPAVLRGILSRLAPQGAFPDLLVGVETSDDAAVWRLSETQALVATTDFFTPIVDEPRDFGRIAATNALSDVYAMGARPILALAIVGMPVEKLGAETIAAILAGGAEVCAAAGVALAGGHSIDAAEPIYGLAAIGLAHPARILTNGGARAGDGLILGKPLGVGILSAALKQQRLSKAGYETLIATTTQLNSVGADLAGTPGVHALTDVTGFGLIGHALEMCRASRLAAEIFALEVPVLAEAEALARSGVKTGASGRNFESERSWLTGAEELEAWRCDLLFDPQTSGGLLIACAPEAVEGVLGLMRQAGFSDAALVGEMKEGPPGLEVKAR
ncbi:MAG: selenide, water dikinase SelD [Caulobacteraceae bacterium]